MASNTVQITLPAVLAENIECFNCGGSDSLVLMPYRTESSERTRALMVVCALCRAAVKSGDLKVTLTPLVSIEGE